MADSIVIWGFIAFVGACIGSFLTLATYRLPRDEKIGMTRSRCPRCNTTLGARDLVPMLSWVMSGGKCRHCKTKVSIRYPLTELACMAGALLSAYFFGFTLQAFAIAGLWWCIVAIIVTDLEHYIILDEVQIAIVLFGGLYHYALGTDMADVIRTAFLGLAIGLTLKYGFLYLRNKDGLGLGDVKLLFGVGVWLADAASFVPFLFYAGILGVAFAGVWRLMGRGKIFPFGPALAAALLMCVILPGTTQAYWQMFNAH